MLLSVKGVNLTGLLGDIKKTGGLGVPQAEAFLWTRPYTHNICIKIQQTTVVAVTG